MSGQFTGPNERGIGDGAEADLIAGLPSSRNAVVSNSANSPVSSYMSQDSASSSTGKSNISWRVNKELMDKLIEMGISSVAAKKALFYTGNSSVEVAAAWIFENPDEDLETPLELDPSVEEMTASVAKSGATAADRSIRAVRQIYKMVFVVNSQLEMGVGKIAAQVAHAALGLHQILLQDEPKYGDSLFKWFEYGETKIVLKGDSTEHLVALEKDAMNVGLPVYLVQDAGKTQVRAGSTTVLAIFGRIDLVDSVTGSLSLL